jgi:hypothetical protein
MTLIDDDELKTMDLISLTSYHYQSIQDDYLHTLSKINTEYLKIYNRESLKRCKKIRELYSKSIVINPNEGNFTVDNLYKEYRLMSRYIASGQVSIYNQSKLGKIMISMQAYDLYLTRLLNSMDNNINYNNHHYHHIHHNNHVSSVDVVHNNNDVDHYDGGNNNIQQQREQYPLISNNELNRILYMFGKYASILTKINNNTNNNNNTRNMKTTSNNNNNDDDDDCGGIDWNDFDLLASELSLYIPEADKILIQQQLDPNSTGYITLSLFLEWMINKKYFLYKNSNVYIFNIYHILINKIISILFFKYYNYDVNQFLNTRYRCVLNYEIQIFENILKFNTDINNSKWDNVLNEFHQICDNGEVNKMVDTRKYYTLIHPLPSSSSSALQSSLPQPMTSQSSSSYQLLNESSGSPSFQLLSTSSSSHIQPTVTTAATIANNKNGNHHQHTTTTTSTTNTADKPYHLLSKLYLLKHQQEEDEISTIYHIAQKKAKYELYYELSTLHDKRWYQWKNEEIFLNQMDKMIDNYNYCYRKDSSATYKSMTLIQPIYKIDKKINNYVDVSNNNVDNSNNIAYDIKVRRSSSFINKNIDSNQEITVEYESNKWFTVMNNNNNNTTTDIHAGNYNDNDGDNDNINNHNNIENDNNSNTIDSIITLPDNNNLLTHYQLLALECFISAFDTNCTGTLNENEIKAVLRSLHFRINEKHFRFYFADSENFIKNIEIKKIIHYIEMLQMKPLNNNNNSSSLTNNHIINDNNNNNNTNKSIIKVDHSRKLLSKTMNRICALHLLICIQSQFIYHNIQPSMKLTKSQKHLLILRRQYEYNNNSNNHNNFYLYENEKLNDNDNNVQSNVNIGINVNNDIYNNSINDKSRTLMIKSQLFAMRQVKIFLNTTYGKINLYNQYLEINNSWNRDINNIHYYYHDDSDVDDKHDENVNGVDGDNVNGVDGDNVNGVKDEKILNGSNKNKYNKSSKKVGFDLKNSSSKSNLNNYIDHHQNYDHDHHHRHHSNIGDNYITYAYSIHYISTQGLLLQEIPYVIKYLIKNLKLKPTEYLDNIYHLFSSTTDRYSSSSTSSKSVNNDEIRWINYHEFITILSPLFNIPKHNSTTSTTNSSNENDNNKNKNNSSSSSSLNINTNNSNKYNSSEYSIYNTRSTGSSSNLRSGQNNYSTDNKYNINNSNNSSSNNSSSSYHHNIRRSKSELMKDAKIRIYSIARQQAILIAMNIPNINVPETNYRCYVLGLYHFIHEYLISSSSSLSSILSSGIVMINCMYTSTNRPKNNVLLVEANNNDVTSNTTSTTTTATSNVISSNNTSLSFDITPVILITNTTPTNNATTTKINKTSKKAQKSSKKDGAVVVEDKKNSNLSKGVSTTLKSSGSVNDNKKISITPATSIGDGGVGGDGDVTSASSNKSRNDKLTKGSKKNESKQNKGNKKKSEKISNDIKANKDKSNDNNAINANYASVNSRDNDTSPSTSTNNKISTTTTTTTKIIQESLIDWENIPKEAASIYLLSKGYQIKDLFHKSLTSYIEIDHFTGELMIEKINIEKLNLKIKQIIIKATKNNMMGRYFYHYPMRIINQVYKGWTYINEYQYIIHALFYYYHHIELISAEYLKEILYGISFYTE